MHCYSALVILLAVVPYELDMIEDLLHSPVLSSLEPLLHFEQVHGVLDQDGIVIEA